MENDQLVIDKALEIIAGRLQKHGEKIDSLSTLKDYLRIKLADQPHESFYCVMLDAQMRVIDGLQELFRGTVTQTAVYPREVVKSALKNNAVFVILSHNHPSGVCEPSQADIMLTKSLQGALDTVGIRVIDHVIIGGLQTLSFAEKGIL